MKSKFKHACFQGDPAFSDAISIISTKKYYSLYPPTMLCRFFPLSPGGNNKKTFDSKSITATAYSTACCSKRASASSIGATFTPSIAATAKFLQYQSRLITSLPSDTRISSSATNYLWWCWCRCHHVQWLCHEICRSRCTLAPLQPKNTCLKKSAYQTWFSGTVQPYLFQLHYVWQDCATM